MAPWGAVRSRLTAVVLSGAATSSAEAVASLSFRHHDAQMIQIGKGLLVAIGELDLLQDQIDGQSTGIDQP